MTTTHMRTWRLIGGLMLAVLLLTACSGGSDSASTSPDRDDGAVEPVPAGEAEAEAQGDGDSTREDAGQDTDAGEALGVSAPALGRKIISTAGLALRVDDVEDTADAVTEQVENANGFVSSVDLHRDADDEVRGSMTLRVPADALTRTLQRLEGLADEVVNRTLGTQDVTEEYTDVESQLRNLETLEGELLELLADVREDGGARGLIRVFDELRGVRGEIEQLEGRRQVLDDQVELATIELSLTPSVDAAPFAVERWAPLGVARQALSATADALQSLATGVIWAVLTVVPVLLVTLGPLAAVTLLARRWLRRRRTSTASAGTSAP